MVKNRYSRIITAPTTPEQYEKLKETAEKKTISISAAVRIAVREWIEKEKSK
jgi:hypothetical protein